MFYHASSVQKDSEVKANKQTEKKELNESVMHINEIQYLCHVTVAVCYTIYENKKDFSVFFFLQILTGMSTKCWNTLCSTKRRQPKRRNECQQLKVENRIIIRDNFRSKKKERTCITFEFAFFMWNRCYSYGVCFYRELII